MYFSLLVSLIASFVTNAAHASVSPCRPFRVHPAATLPPAPSVPVDLTSCIAHYSSMDHDRDGRMDWALVEGTRGDVLYPADPDLDGDGIENVFDSNPLTLDTRLPASDEIPPHLAMTGERGRLQKEIFEKTGVVAIDHTDRHSLAVLTAFRDVALRALSPGFQARTPSVRFLYAFKGHDARLDVAAYHRETKSISIGGESSWRSIGISSEDRIRVTAALAHEIGHAFLFDRMTPSELVSLGTAFGDWGNVVANAKPARFHDATFLKVAHPFKRLSKLFKGSDEEARVFMNRDVWLQSSIVSPYSTTNLHEWFADAFAAHLLNVMGEQGALPTRPGESWRRSLAIVPRGSAFWANYNNLSSGLRLWMKARIGSTASARLQ